MYELAEKLLDPLERKGELGNMPTGSEFRQTLQQMTEGIRHGAGYCWTPVSFLARKAEQTKQYSVRL